MGTFSLLAGSIGMDADVGISAMPARTEAGVPDSSARSPMNPDNDAHEDQYRLIRERGLGSWNALRGLPDIEPAVERFLTDALEQSWVPASGAALELGCGTGPLSRWLHARGWEVTSATAIELARSQSRGLPIRYLQESATRLSSIADVAMDLVLDGQCLHCITDDGEREAYFREAARVLRPGGCLLLLSMARPVLAARFRALHGPLRQGRVYRESASRDDAAGSIRIDGRNWVPVRCLEHWRLLLQRLKGAGLEPRLIRLNNCHPEDPLSYLACAACRC